MECKAEGAVYATRESTCALTAEKSVDEESSVPDEDRRRRRPAESGLECTNEEITSLIREHGAECHGTISFQTDHPGSPVGVHRAIAEVLANRFEIGKGCGTRDAKRADSGKDGQPIAVNGDGDLAGNAHHAPGDEEDGADEKREAEKRHSQIEVALHNLCAVNSGHRSTRPDTGKWHDEERHPAAGAGAGGESISRGRIPGAGGRRVQIDRTRRRDNRRNERGQDAAGSAQDLREMERIAAGAAEHCIGGDVDIVCRGFGAAGGTGDLHEFEGIMP